MSTFRSILHGTSTAICLYNEHLKCILHIKRKISLFTVLKKESDFSLVHSTSYVASSCLGRPLRHSYILHVLAFTVLSTCRNAGIATVLIVVPACCHGDWLLQNRKLKGCCSSP